MTSTNQAPVVPEMQARLRANKSGKLTTGQWLDIVLQPLTPLLLLLLPGALIILPRVLLFTVRGGWLALLLIPVVLLISFAIRARRYARAPVQFAQLRALHNTAPVWMYWRSLVMADDAGGQIHFRKRLAPRPFVNKNQLYLVYYLVEGDEHVLLSIAPVDHPRGERWLPDRSFFQRYERRSRNA
jgi:uncharacterized membrane protein SirB2